LWINQYLKKGRESELKNARRIREALRDEQVTDQ
jgi:hypothetical protein